jgi:hypothetical protein
MIQVNEIHIMGSSHPRAMSEMNSPGGHSNSHVGSYSLSSSNSGGTTRVINTVYKSLHTTIVQVSNFLQVFQSRLPNHVPRTCFGKTLMSFI